MEMDNFYMFISATVFLIIQHQVLCLVFEPISIHDSVSVHALLLCKSLVPLRQSLAVLGIIEWSLAKDGRAFSFSQLCVIAAWHSPVGNNSIVPECDRARGPFPSRCQVICVGEVLAKEGENVVRLLSVELLDALDEGRVVEERLEARYWMSSHQRMGSGDGGSVWCSSAVDGSQVRSLCLPMLVRFLTVFTMTGIFKHTSEEWMA